MLSSEPLSDVVPLLSDVSPRSDAPAAPTPGPAAGPVEGNGGGRCPPLLRYRQVRII